MRETDANQLESLEQELEKLKNAAAYDGMESNQMNSLQWADFKTKHARKAFAIGITLLILSTFDGVTFTAPNVLHVLQQFGIGIPWSRIALIFEIVPILGTCIAMQLVDQFGRKVKKTACI